MQIRPLVILVAALALGTGCALHRAKQSPPRDPGTADAGEVSPLILQRGKKMTSMMCGPCHFDPQTRALSGRVMNDLPEKYGSLSATNITRDHEHGAGKYTRSDFVKLLRTGVTPEAKVSPTMAFPHLADDDLRAIAAFLRSNHPLVEPVAKPVPPTKLRPAVHLFTALKARPLPRPEEPIPRPPEDDALATGQYLAVNLGCYSCHSAHLTSNRKRAPEKSRGYMAGGATLRTGDGKPIRAPNLTFDKETGIGSWTAEQFRRSLQLGLRPDGAPVRFPMPLYPELDDREADAIFAYLQSLPPEHHQIERSLPPPPTPTTEPAPLPEGDPLAAGRDLYTRYACQSCHGETGRALGDLTAAWKKYSDKEIIAYIKNPGNFIVAPQMPPFAAAIPDSEFPVLITFIKHLGKTAAPAATD